LWRFPSILSCVLQPSPRDLPEHACASFEQATGWDLCLHDPSQILWRFLPPARFAHLRPPCTLVKQAYQERCAAFEAERATAAAQRVPGGIVKQCHAGIIEVAVAVSFSGAPWLTLFAGARRAQVGAAGVAIDLRAETHLAGTWGRALAALPAAHNSELQVCAELLLQLGARLVAWRATALPTLTTPEVAQSRRECIEQWIQRHHRETVRLEHLATVLGLSPDRASHAITSACGRGFSSLLAAERIRSACDLLRRSDLPLDDIARLCGFRERTRFHKVFAATLGISPARWRRTGGA
jgi:AraC-like DNA-binding protein